uniref:Uncharacterized protein n=1 Tax=Vespula pensylvanica TaxID=30213 RepID=A0A834NPS7_VESPE|nr:hypothetical protein H0235_011915 [Vespula pensylvanica]
MNQHDATHQLTRLSGSGNIKCGTQPHNHIECTYSNAHVRVTSTTRHMSGQYSQQYCTMDQIDFAFSRDSGNRTVVTLVLVSEYHYFRAHSSLIFHFGLYSA